MSNRYKKLDWKNRHIVALKTDERHVYTVEYNPANGVFFINLPKKKLQWKLTAAEFVYRSPGFNPIVNKFPCYVHAQVWMIQDYMYYINRTYSEDTIVKRLDRHYRRPCNWCGKPYGNCKDAECLDKVPEHC